MRRKAQSPSCANAGSGRTEMAKRAKSPFVLVLTAAAHGESIALSPGQCRALAKDDRFYERAVDDLTDEEAEIVKRRGSYWLSGFKRLRSPV
jgi:hypothetical protein